METPRLHWMRGRVDESAGQPRTLEWIGCDEAGAAVARVIRVLGPFAAGYRLYRAVALDEEARVVELRPTAPEGADWLACVGGQVVGRAPLPLQAVRTAEAAIK